MGRDHGQLFGADAHDQLGQQRRELRFQPCLAGRHTTRRCHPLSEGGSNLFEGAVLQKPGKEQVPGLDEGQVLLVFQAQLRQQAGRLDIEQSCRHQQELRGLAQVPFGVSSLMGPDVCHELVGHLGQGDLGDVELVLGDQPEQELERTLEDVQMYLERPAASPPQHPAGSHGRPWRHDRAHGAQAVPPREISSRAS